MVATLAPIETEEQAIESAKRERSIAEAVTFLAVYDEAGLDMRDLERQREQGGQRNSGRSIRELFIEFVAIAAFLFWAIAFTWSSYAAWKAWR